MAMNGSAVEVIDAVIQRLSRVETVLSATEQRMATLEGVHQEIMRNLIGSEHKSSKQKLLNIKRARDIMPNQWSGEAGGSFRDLSHEIMLYFCEAHEQAPEIIRSSEAYAEDPDDLELNTDYDAELTRAIDSELAVVLARVTKGEALTIVRNCGE